MKLEMLLQKYIGEVKDGTRASSVRSVQTFSSLSPTDEQAWRQVRRELQDIGISPLQFDRNKELIITKLQEAFGQASNDPTIETNRTISRISRLLSSVTGKSQALLDAVKNGRVGDVRNALQRKAYVDVAADSFSYNRTPLLIAAERGDAEVVQLLLEYNANVNKKDHLTYTPLHLAVQQGHVQVARTLLEHGSNVNAHTDNWNITPLHDAITKNCLASARLVLDHGAHVDAVGWKNQETPLHGAVTAGAKDMVDLLLAHKAKFIYGDLGSPLHRAVDTRNVALAETLIDHFGAAANETTPINQRSGNSGDSERSDYTKRREGSPLWVAAASGCQEMVELLLRSNTDVTEKAFTIDCQTHISGSCLFCTRGGLQCTALHIAVAHGHQNIARILFDAGASLDQPITGATSIAYRHGSYWSPYEATPGVVGKTQIMEVAVEASTTYPQFLRLLLRLNSKVDQVLESGRTALHIAAWQSASQTEHQLVVVHMLTEHGADIHARDNLHRTPLHYATMGNGDNALVVDLLLRNGAKIPAADIYGHTPLHYAAMYHRQSRGVLDALLRNGADPNVINIVDKARLPLGPQVSFTDTWMRNLAPRYFLPRATPLHYAAFNRLSQNVRFLIRCGGDISITDGDGRNVAQRWHDTPLFKENADMPDMPERPPPWAIERMSRAVDRVSLTAVSE